MSERVKEVEDEYNDSDLEDEEDGSRRTSQLLSEDKTYEMNEPLLPAKKRATQKTQKSKTSQVTKTTMATTSKATSTNPYQQNL